MNVWLRIANWLSLQRADQRELSGPMSAAETSPRASCAKTIKPAIRECPRRPRWSQERPLKAAAGLELSRTVFTAPGQVGSFHASAAELLATPQRGGLENARLPLAVGRRHASQGAERDAPATVRSRRRVVGQETQGGRATTLLERAATAGAEKRGVGSARAV